MRSEKLNELNSIVSEYKTIKLEKTNSDSKFIKVVPHLCYINNGRVITREKIVKSGSDGSAVIVMSVTPSNEVLVVVEPRFFTKNGVGVGFPSGYINEGEDAISAAYRELCEETGYVPKRVEEIDAYYQDEGCSSAYNHSLIAWNCVKMYDQRLDDSEMVKYMLFSYDELFELEDMGLITGANTKLTLAKSRKYMKGY